MSHKQQASEGFPALFVATFSPGPRWDEFASEREQQIGLHRDYQRTQLAAGKFIIGGPFVGQSGGMALYRVGSRAEMEEIIANDPSVISGVYQVDLRQWRVGMSVLSAG
jgi:uncharacterized protein YciI